MASRQAHAACGPGGRVATRLRQRVFDLSAAFLVLGVSWVAIGFFHAPVSAQTGPVEQSQAVGWIPMDPAQSPVDVVPAVQAPGRVTTVGHPALSKPDDDWDGKKAMKTVDNGPSGQIKWLPDGRVQVCDLTEDGHLVRGYVHLDGEKINLEGGRGKGPGKGGVRAGEKGKCDEGRIPNYKKNKKYKITVCLSRSDKHPDGYCNYSSSKDWPEVERTRENFCLKVWQDTYQRGGEYGPTLECVGGVDEYCKDFAGTFFDSLEDNCVEEVKAELKKSVLGPPKKPKGWKPDKYYITHRPDAGLPKGHAKGVGKVNEPLKPLLRWVAWAALGGCVLGIMLVGGNMALKHKRSEAGAHAASLSWVMFACVLAGSGMAIALISLLVDPL